MPTKIKIIIGDITITKVEAIVNAANKSLLGGGGVDGAIHRAAGTKLKEFCWSLGGCQTGEAKITPGYNLSANFIIHTVGPFYGQENGNEDALLTACYQNSLIVAKENNIKTIAFPCISTGVFRFPRDKAAQIAVKAVKDFVNKNPKTLEEIIFVTHDEIDYEIYKNIITSHSLL